jgi:hypothetical protein
MRGVDNVNIDTIAHQNNVQLCLATKDMGRVDSRVGNLVAIPVLSGNRRVESHELVNVALQLTQGGSRPDLCNPRVADKVVVLTQAK